jgi:anti-sigma B factor antagonist
MNISSRTPEGSPNSCPVCGKEVCMEPSRPANDAPCPHCGHLLWFGSARVMTQRDVTVVRFSGKKIVDGASIQSTGEELFALFGLVDRLERRKLLLNFASIEHLPSAALGKLITLNKKLQAVGGKLVLCGIRPQVYETFEITKLDKFFKIVPNENEGLASF